MKLNKKAFPQVSSSRNVAYTPSSCNAAPTTSSRNVFMRDIKSFLRRPILRTETLRNDGAAATHGFTLIELLVVVLIIGILSAIALPQYQKAVVRSRATQAMTTLKALSQAQVEYHLANGVYSGNKENLSISFDESLSCSSTTDYVDCRIGIENTDISFAWIGYHNGSYQYRWECVTPIENVLGNQICLSYPGAHLGYSQNGKNCYYILVE